MFACLDEVTSRATSRTRRQVHNGWLASGIACPQFKLHGLSILLFTSDDIDMQSAPTSDPPATLNKFLIPL
ncbi:hypothetical protein E2C01_091227 [Portunus trituberculatus]|uniref:Uncharacterized protein n=1 Tax=Portunus trituberculatus TaxID=210409 RepID=A0A5B7JUG8_PORTR|nr:hypothetical protein [Portunus trituberculatus]